MTDLAKPAIIPSKAHLGRRPPTCRLLAEMWYRSLGSSNGKISGGEFVDMVTRDMASWETAICKVVSQGDTEEIIVRGHRMSDLIGQLSFAEMMFLMLQGRIPTKAQARTLDALLVASMEHGIAPPSMIARCYASYGTTLPVAIGAGANAFGDRMGALGEKMAKMLVARLAVYKDGRVPTDAELPGRCIANGSGAGGLQRRRQARYRGYSSSGAGADGIAERGWNGQGALASALNF